MLLGFFSCSLLISKWKFFAGAALIGIAGKQRVKGVCNIEGLETILPSQFQLLVMSSCSYVLPRKLQVQTESLFLSTSFVFLGQAWPRQNRWVSRTTFIFIWHKENKERKILWASLAVAGLNRPSTRLSPIFLTSDSQKHGWLYQAST